MGQCRVRNRGDKVGGGGIAIYVNHGLTVHQHSASSIQEVEALTVICRPSYLPRCLPWLAFILIYYPPRDNFHDLMINYVMQEVDRILSINVKAGIYIMGDFNDIDTRRFSQLAKFTQIIHSPTRGSAILDKCFTNVAYVNNVKYLPPIAKSDHVTILVTPKQQFAPENGIKSVNIRRKRKSYFGSMADVLCKHDWSMWSLIDDVQVAADLFYELMNSVYEITFPISTVWLRSNDHPWMNKQIFDLIKTRDSCGYVSGDGDGYKMLSCEVKKLIKVAKSSICQRLMRYYSESPRLYHSSLLAIFSGVGRADKKEVSFRDISVGETNELIVSFFRQLLNLHNPGVFPNVSVDEHIPPIEVCFVLRCLHELNSRSSPAPFDIPNFIYNEFAVFLAEPIARLINMSLEQRVCPHQWKVAFLVPIPKVKSPLDPSYIRPIAISHSIAKICEKHVLNLLRCHTVNIIDPMQFGGVPNRSTIQYIAIYLHRAINHLDNKGSSVISVFTDFRKAFDNVDHTTLLLKLADLSIPVALISWIASFLTDRVLFLKNASSVCGDFIQCTNGIPQGSVLGSFLFAIVVNSLAEFHPHRLKYVDDLTISVLSFKGDAVEEDVKVVVEGVVQQSEKLLLPLNPSKCNLIIHSFIRNRPKVSVQINNQTLSQVDCVKVLGIYIQEDLKWNTQVHNMVCAANRRMCYLYVLRRLGASWKIMINTYVVYIRPLLEYGAPVWHSALTARQSDLLEGVQRRALRIILDREHVSYANDLKVLGLCSLRERRKGLLLGFARNFFTNFPQFKPPTRGQITGINTRFSSKCDLQWVRTNRAKLSPIFSFARAVNDNMDG